MTIDEATAELERASAKLRPGLTMKQGGGGWEKRYGQAYQALVTAGAKPQIRKRYRG